MRIVRFVPIAALTAALLVLPTATWAQDDEAAKDVAQANNALAAATALNFHDYYIGEQTETGEEANQLWARLAQPFSIGSTSWLTRISLPLNTYPVAPDFEQQTGLGDLNILAAWLVDTGRPGLTFGIGPQITMDTATEDATGSGKWSAGLANYVFFVASPKLQIFYLLTWQASFAGDDDRDDVNVVAFQPGLVYQLPHGFHLRSTAIWTWDLEHDTYSVPLGFGAGKVIRTEKRVYNLFVEPQWSVVDDGAGWPEWQVFVGFNTTFK